MVRKVAEWQGGKVIKWQSGKVAKWQGDKAARYIDTLQLCNSATLHRKVEVS